MKDCLLREILFKFTLTNNDTTNMCVLPTVYQIFKRVVLK